MFRKNVVESQGKRLFGVVSLAQPMSLYLSVLIIFTSIVAILTFVATSSYARKETVKGYLTPSSGVIKIYPTQIGTLDTLNVNEGDIVKEGQILAKVVLERHQLNGLDLNESVISALEKQKELLERDLLETETLAERELDGLKQKVLDLQLAVDSTDRQIKLLTKKYTIQMKEYGRYEHLSESKFVSKIELQRQEQEVLLIEEALESANSSKLSLVSQLNEVKRQISTSPHEAELRITQILRSKAQIQRQIDEAKNNFSFGIVAKESGIVTAIVAREGELLSTSRPLLSIIPEGTELVAELFFPTRSAGFIKLENEVRLRFDAFPYQRFGFVESRVSRIDKSLLMEGEVDIPIPLTEPVYRVQAQLTQQLISAYGDSFPLKAGMIFEADIILENRSLFQWILDPIYSLRGRIG